MTLEEKVRNSKVSDYIFAMVEGLTNPKIKIDMQCFGIVRGGKIYGCAATVAIFQLDPSLLAEIDTDAPTLGSRYFYPREYEFINWFEDVFDAMRYGNMEGTIFANANKKLNILGLPYIQVPPSLEGKLPYLGSEYTKEQLEPYRELAEYNKSIGN